MIGDSLKISILKAAFTGNLTKQSNNDTSLDKMITMIDSKHTELINNKIIKNEKKIEEIKSDDYLFDIPNNWFWSKLYFAIDVRDGTHDSPRYFKEGVPFITSKNLNDNGQLDYNNVKYISEEDAKIINSRSKVEIGDILFAMIGSNIGNPVIIIDPVDFCIKNVALFKNPIKEYLDNNYLYYYLYFSQFKMKNDSIGGAQQFVSLNYLRNFPIPIPPIEEQKRIVDKIEVLLNKIEEIKPIELKLQSIKMELPDKIKKSILQFSCMGKLTEQYSNELVSLDVEKISSNEIPNNWVRTKLANILNITTGRKDANYGTLDGKYLFYTCANVPIKSPTYSFEGKNIILPGNGANVGMAIYCEEQFEAYQRTYVVSSKYSENELYLKYIYYYFCAFWNDYNKDKMFGSAIPYIKLGNLESFELNIPPIEEQKRIIERIEQILPLCDDIDKLVNG